MLVKSQKLKITLFFGILLLAIIYLGLAPRFATALYRPFLFHPIALEKELKAPTIEGIAGEDIFIKQSDNTVMHGWFYRLPGAHYTTLVSHGNGGNISLRTDLIESLLKAGTSVFIYDYSGYGKSTGEPHLSTICFNAVSAYDYLVSNQKIAAQTIVAYGESLGGAVAAYLSSVRPVRGIIIQSGFLSLRQISLEKFPFLAFYPNWLFPEPPLDNSQIFLKGHVPLLIIHGTDDLVVPYHHAEQLFEAATEPKQIVALRGVGHNDVIFSQPERFQKFIRDYLANLQ